METRLREFTNVKLNTLILIFAFFSMLISQVAAKDVNEDFNLHSVKLAYENSKPHSFKRGDTRGYANIFQGKIDKETSISEQLAINSVTRKNHDGELPWTFDADDHLYSWVDLNKDGILDVIMLFYHTAYCGIVGCEGFVFLNVDNKLEYAASLTIWGESVRTHEVDPSGNLSIFSKNECLLWTKEKYQYHSGYAEKYDGQEDWNPHVCGNHFDLELLKAKADCQACHHTSLSQ